MLNFCYNFLKQTGIGGISMTFEQMKCAIEIASCGSISKAAKNLYLSQPRLSQSIKNMEDEMGYLIFERFPQGIVPTAKGKLFLNHCEIILAEYKKAAALSEQKTLRSFHLAAGNLYLFMEAFIRLCQDYQNDTILDLQIHHKNSYEIEEAVYQGISQLGILLVKENELNSYILSAERKNLVAKPLCHIGLVITLRKDHPALSQSFNITDLYMYPFADYGQREVSRIFMEETRTLVNPEKIIRVNEAEGRHKIISRTNAFGIGCELSESILSQYNLVSIPVQDAGFQIVSLSRRQSPYFEEIKCYLDHLMDVIKENHFL